VSSSGGHFNPAVSLSVALSRKMPLLLLPAYIFSQLMGGIVGAFFVRV
jgi:glycerol uptake facilitator-like aquaporin